MKQEKNEKVIVNIRIRPFTQEESSIDKTTPIEQVDIKTNSLLFKRDLEAKPFTFDRIFPMNSTQEEIFNLSSKGVIEAVIKGYNGTIFTYGQTGSGKTYTMTGEYEHPERRGIIPRAIDYIFANLANEKGYKQYVFVSFIQIYLETIQDLLNLSGNEIRIREDPEEGVFLEGVEWFKVSSPEDVRTVYLYGEKNRITESTKMNAHSSRSHAIFIIRFEKTVMQTKEKLNQIAKKSNEQIMSERVLTRSNLYLVDLAGSERVSKSKAVDLRLEETKKINYSLLVLGNCISSLVDLKSNHVCYRDSKLTRLLQESLGGNAKTSMIVTLSPSSYNKEETFSSLNFALRAMKIQNKPLINKVIDYQLLSMKLQDDLDKLIDEFASMKIKHEKVLLENSKIKGGEEYLEMQKKSLSLLLEESPVNINKDSDYKYQAELQKLKAYYEKVIENNKKENQNILNEIDRILYDKEKEIEQLKKTNSSIKEMITSLNEQIEEMKKENNDLKQNVLYLTNKAGNDTPPLTTKCSNSEGNMNHINEEKQLIIEKEDSQRDDMIRSHAKVIDTEIGDLMNKKQDLEHKLKSGRLQASKNEIQMRISKEELFNSLEIDDNKKETLEKEIAVKAEENNSFLSEKAELNKRISGIEKEIEIKEELKKKLLNMKEEIGSNLTQLLCEVMNTDSKNRIKLDNKEKEYQSILNDKHVLIKEKSELTKDKEKLSTQLNEIKQRKSHLTLSINQAIEINCLRELSTIKPLITIHPSEKLSFINQKVPYLKIINENNKVNYIGKKPDKSIYIDLQNKINEVNHLSNKLLETQTQNSNLTHKIESQLELNMNLNKINAAFSNQLSSLSKITAEIDRVNQKVTLSPSGSIDSSTLLFLLNNDAISDHDEAEENGMNNQKSSIICSSTSLSSSECLDEIKTNFKSLIDNYRDIVNAYSNTLVKSKQSFSLIDDIKKTQLQNMQKTSSMLSSYNDISLTQLIQQRVSGITMKTSIQDVIVTSNVVYNELILHFLTSIKKKQKEIESNEALISKVSFNLSELSQTSNTSNDKMKIQQYEAQIESMTETYEAEINEKNKKIEQYEAAFREMDNDLNTKSSNIELSTKINFVLVYILMLVSLSVIIY